jgi:hypothetical protein
MINLPPINLGGSIPRRVIAGFRAKNNEIHYQKRRPCPFGFGDGHCLRNGPAAGSATRKAP